MRLREIANVIRNVDLKSLDVDGDNTGTTTALIKNLDAFRTTVLTLADIPAFQGYTIYLKGSSVFGTALDEFRVSSAEYYAIRSQSNQLRLAASGLLSSISDQLSGEELDSISVKLPDDRNLKTIINDLSSIEKAISQVTVNPTINGKVEVNTWEPGSLWIEIYLGCAAATSLIGSLAWASMVVRKKQQEARIFEQYARGLELKNDGLSSLLEGQRSAIELQIESEALALDDEYFSAEKADPERIQRLQYAIKEFSKLIERGAEIHPALSAPESVKNLFPSMINPMAIESKIHRIEDSKSTGSE